MKGGVTAEEHKEGAKCKAKGVVRRGLRWGRRLRVVRASGRGELRRRTGLPHESRHSKDEVWKEGRCRCCKFSNSFGKEKNKPVKGGSKKCVLK